MRKANLLIAIVMTSLVYIDYQYYVIPIRFLQSVGAASMAREGDPLLVAQAYTFYMELSQKSPGSANTYLPRFEPIDLAESTRLYVAFGLEVGPQGVIETSDTFFVSDDNAVMTVSKYERTLRYVPYFEPAAPGATPINMERAIELAREFVSGRRLYTPFYEIEVEFDGVVYDLTYVNRLAGLKNHSFATRLTLDRFGRVLEFTFSDMSFERLSNHGVLSMLEASAYLPTDFEGHAYITSAELVYTYLCSIVQPAYLFSGHLGCGTKFERFVPAAEFAS
jgi:hypothetical protein